MANSSLCRVSKAKPQIEIEIGIAIGIEEKWPAETRESISIPIKENPKSLRPRILDNVVSYKQLFLPRFARDQVPAQGFQAVQHHVFGESVDQRLSGVDSKAAAQGGILQQIV